MRAAILLLTLLPLAAPAVEATPEPWHPEDGDICLRPGDAPRTDAQRHLAALLDRMRPVFDGFPSLAEAWKTTAPPLCIEDRGIAARGYLETTSPRIVLRDGLPPGAQALILVHELRHLEQWTRGTCLHDGLTMAAHVRAAFVLEADAAAVTALVAWAEAEAGRDDLWHAMRAMPMFADIGAAFAAQMRDGAGVAAATAAAFDRWYAQPERTGAYYRAVCSDYLDRLDATKRLPGSGALPGDYLTDVCRLPSGGGYACAEPTTLPR